MVTPRRLLPAAPALLLPLAAPPAGAVEYYGSLGLGYETNVLLAADPGATADTDDTFTEALGVAVAPLTDGESVSTRFQATGYYLQYHELDGYDVGSFSAGPSLTWRSEPWRFDLMAQGTQVLLAEEGFLRLATAEAELRRYWGQATYLTAAYRQDRLSGQDGYDYLTGDRRRWSLTVQAGDGIWTGKGGYELEHNDRRDLAEGGNFSSYSPTRHTLHGKLKRQWARGSLAARAEYRYSRYADPHEQNGDTATRKDHRYKAGLRATVDLSADAGLFADATRTINRSSLDDPPFTDYSYADSYFLVGVDGSF